MTHRDRTVDGPHVDRSASPDPTPPTGSGGRTTVGHLLETGAIHSVVYGPEACDG